MPAADATCTSYWVYVVRGHLKGIPAEVCVLISRRHPGEQHPAYFFTTDVRLAPTQVLTRYGHRWGCEVDNYVLKVLLGLADFQLQKWDGVLRWHAVVFLTLAYLQWRRTQAVARAPSGPIQTVCDVIEQHRREHLTAFIQAVAHKALETGSVTDTLKHFERFVGASP